MGQGAARLPGAHCPPGAHLPPRTWTNNGQTLYMDKPWTMFGLSTIGKEHHIDFMYCKTTSSQSLSCSGKCGGCLPITIAIAITGINETENHEIYYTNLNLKIITSHHCTGYLAAMCRIIWLKAGGPSPPHLCLHMNSFRWDLICVLWTPCIVLSFRFIWHQKFCKEHWLYLSQLL